MLNLNSIFTICEKYEITIDTFIRLYIVYSEELYTQGIQSYKIRPLVGLYQYVQSINKETEKKEIKGLISKGLVISGELFDECVVSDAFIESLYIYSSQATDELFSVYPEVVEVRDKKTGAKSVFPLKAVNKEELKYAGKINNDVLLHEQIITAVKKAKDLEEKTGTSYINMKIDKFVDSEYWNTLFNLLEKESHYKEDEAL